MARSLRGIRDNVAALVETGSNFLTVPTFSIANRLT